MKTLFLCIVFAFSIYFTKANPIITIPLMITELNFDNNGNWVIELKNSFINNIGFSDLNNVRITTSTGSYYFKPGINLTPNQLFLINNDSLILPLTINRNNDFILLEEYYGGPFWFQIWNSLSFGDNSSHIIGPVGLNQSIDLYTYQTGIPPETNFFYVKSSVSSLGVFPVSNIELYNNSKGNFQGYVYDRNNNPISSNQVFLSYRSIDQNIMSYTTANLQSGYFNFETYSCRYQLWVGFNGVTNPHVDTTIIIEPGDTNNCIFHLDCVSGINAKENAIISEIYNYPNPVSENTIFTFNLPSNTSISKSIIKIYNNNGEIVKILPVSLFNLNGNKYSIPLNIKNDNVFSSGIYYYCLEINGTKVGSNKMTVIK